MAARPVLFCSAQDPAGSKETALNMTRAREKRNMAAWSCKTWLCAGDKRAIREGRDREMGTRARAPTWFCYRFNRDLHDDQ
ncbi:hypothetical protein GGTG_10582 [Gaeumannomyces tritici R3-111a-1]|uniref:Uncharacterized protein n=1 Tax=Gaeumannomyces tritici (strain R3-111a-1) TaxID=644352 RepID=J3PAQ7_GAET3|nr:hypothetical protein GGTG_10582 [Gaeumannomyces tritici R3-111a-1]EJT71323.1 hypothetical protein GGTG_10582 [Gaeumannomyces tritici R3-111a-1]